MARPRIERRSGLAPGLFWTRRRRPAYDSSSDERRLLEVPMVAIIGNVIAGLLALSLFTATVRLTK